MPKRLVPFITGEYYHVFNRGINKMQIFNTSKDYKHFIQCANYYKYKDTTVKFSHFKLNDKLLFFKHNQVEIISYCLMPNHFHMLVQQTQEKGIQTFLGKLQNSYTRYYNIKSNRTGPLFQGRFKSAYINKDEQLMHIIRYIHLNPLVGGLVTNLDDYPWSSYKFIHKDTFQLETKLICDYFKSIKNYFTFLNDHINYAKQLESIKHFIFE